MGLRRVAGRTASDGPLGPVAALVATFALLRKKVARDVEHGLITDQIAIIQAAFAVPASGGGARLILSPGGPAVFSH